MLTGKVKRRPCRWTCVAGVTSPAGCGAADPRVAAGLGSAAICCQPGPVQPTGMDWGEGRAEQGCGPDGTQPASSGERKRCQNQVFPFFKMTGISLPLSFANALTWGRLSRNSLRKRDFSFKYKRFGTTPKHTAHSESFYQALSGHSREPERKLQQFSLSVLIGQEVEIIRFCPWWRPC